MNQVSGYAPYLVAVWIFAWGLWGIATSRHFAHLVMCLAVTQTSTYVLLVAIASRRAGAPPIVRELSPTEHMADPVLQALMLTDVVVEAAVMALLLALAVITHRRTGKLDPSELRLLRG